MNARNFLAGLYTWVVTIYLGAVLLDIVNYHLAANANGAAEKASLFSEGADFLLLILALVIFTSLAAVVSTWFVAPARNAFIASILCILLPLLFYSLIEAVNNNLVLNFGLWVRLVTSSMASILGFVGLGELFSHTQG